jgi:hypothetical protein
MVDKAVEPTVRSSRRRFRQHGGGEEVDEAVDKVVEPTRRSRRRFRQCGG